MAFLENNDYSLVIKPKKLQLLLDELEDSAQADAETVAMSLMNGYFRKRFIDIPNIWNKTGDDRNMTVKLMLLHLVVYILHNGVDPDVIPETITKNNDTAIKWLKDVADGTIQEDLPLLTDTNNEVKHPSRFGNRGKFDSSY
jgi:hypothetical protein